MISSVCKGLLGLDISHLTNVTDAGVLIFPPEFSANFSRTFSSFDSVDNRVCVLNIPFNKGTPDTQRGSNSI